MGPVRRGLGAAALPATPAGAEVCDKVRPEWSASDGPVGALGEAAALLPGLGAVAIVLIVLLALNWQRAGLVVAAALLAAAVLSTSPDPTGIGDAARAEGCIGPGWVLLAALLALAALPVAGWARSRHARA